MTIVEKFGISIERASVNEDGTVNISLNFGRSDAWGAIHFTMESKSAKPVRDAAVQLGDFAERLYEFIKEG